VTVLRETRAIEKWWLFPLKRSVFPLKWTLFQGKRSPFQGPDRLNIAQQTPNEALLIPRWPIKSLLASTEGPKPARVTVGDHPAASTRDVDSRTTRSVSIKRRATRQAGRAREC
jgi:hypothetical protein